MTWFLTEPDPLWTAFAIGLFFGIVVTLSLVCLLYILGNNHACEDCPYLPDEEEPDHA